MAERPRILRAVLIGALAAAAVLVVLAVARWVRGGRDPGTASASTSLLPASVASTPPVAGTSPGSDAVGPAAPVRAVEPPPPAGSDPLGRAWQRRTADGGSAGGMPAPAAGMPTAPVDLSWRFSPAGPRRWELAIRLVPRGRGRELTCAVGAGDGLALTVAPQRTPAPAPGEAWGGAYLVTAAADPPAGWVDVRWGLDGRERHLRFHPGADPSPPAAPAR